MKVGDTVRHRFEKGRIGVVLRFQGESIVGKYWEIFDSKHGRIYGTTRDFEVISESRRTGKN